MKELKNEVVTVVTPMGEIVGRAKDITGDYIDLEDPRLFVHQGEQAGFVPGVAAAGQQNPSKMRFFTSSIITVCAVRPDIESGWREQTSGIIA